MRYIDNIVNLRYVVWMDHLIHIAGQLSPHLKSLRKAKGLTQAQLGALLGLGQVRIAEIEKNPAAISTDQLLRLLAALDTQVVLRPAQRARPATGKSPAAKDAGAHW